MQEIVTKQIPEQSEQPPQPWYGGGRGLLIGIGLGLAIAFVGSRIIPPGQASRTAPEEAIAAKSKAPVQTVTVAEVESTTVSRTLDATGTVAAFEMIPVTAQATGLQIESVLVEEGSYVKTGQPLVRLNSAVLRAQLAQANAAVAQAEARLAELQAGSRSEEIAQARAQVTEAKARSDLARERARRYQSLRKDGAIAQDRLDEVLTEKQRTAANLQEAQRRLALVQAGPRREVVTQAEARLAEAKAQVQLVTAQLKDTNVLAPRSGKIAQRNARVGDTTSSSQELFQIIQNGRLELRVQVPETQLSQIRPGQKVAITSGSDAALKLTGTVREIDPLVDAESRQAIVKVDLPSAASLQPGMFLKAAITTSSSAGLTIPSGAVLPQPDGNAIAYKVNADSTVAATAIEVGKLLPGERVEILSGLNAGDRIAVKGAAYLKDGDRVEF